MENQKYEVYVTNDYDLFKRLPGNRDVTEARLTKIVKSIQEVGYIKNPIIVNDHMEIIDGQGRFRALRRLGLPIEYIIADGTGMKECIRMNMDMINWKLPDFIKSYADQGNENYIRLKTLVENYVGGNLSIITTALYRISKPISKDIKDGSLQVTQEQFDYAKECLEYVQPILNELDLDKLPSTHIKLMQTLIYYYGQDGVDKDRLKDKVLRHIYGGRPWITNPDCERTVEDVYNHHIPLENRQLISHLLREERLRRDLVIRARLSARAKERTQPGVQGFITNE